MFRNREIKKFAALFAIITAISITAGFAINFAAGVLSVISATVYGVAFFVFTNIRYKIIAQLSDHIDTVLHGGGHLYISKAREGELSILESEITKMTICIREQNNALKREKEHLASSLADIAHQLRTPLTSASIILSLVEKGTDDSRQKKLVREMEELFVQMDWLITSLLKLSRLDAGIVIFKKEQTCVNSILKTAARPFLIPMELHNISLEICVPADIKIWCDAGWLSEAVQNILKNCMESTGDSGSIKIGCEDNPLYTEITIHDSGKGFKKEELPYLFDRFYKGGSQGSPGYGIGLALCRTVITRQGGTVTAKNHPRGGAVFTIRFPKSNILI